MLANTAVPVLGLTDTAIIGHWGTSQDLAALAAGTIAATFIFWNFGFLRMTTTALVARSLGENQPQKAAEYVARAIFIALILSTLMIVLKATISPILVNLLAPPKDAYAITHKYLAWRLWSAPATLLMYIVSGVLLAAGRSHAVLGLQFFTCALNAVFDIYLVYQWELGATGVALGTVAAEYCAVVIAVLTARRTLPLSSVAAAFSSMSYRLSAFKSLLRSNRDIWIRTFFLLVSFMVFTHLSGRFGTTTLAANHILLQLISFSAFFLDGYAHVTEAYIGDAIGRNSRDRLRDIIQKGWVLSQVTALVLAGFLIALSNLYLPLLTDITEIAVRSQELLLFSACYVTLSASAFHLDGVFIGANASSALRNASIFSSLAFFTAWILVGQFIGIAGLWLCFISFVVFRAIALSFYLPNLMGIAKASA